jgi:hypothetical protein
MKGEKLSFYPTDIISIIVEHLDAYDLASLWICGDKRLNFILCETVKRFELVYPVKSKGEWPRLISHFPTLDTLIVSAPLELSLFEVSGVDLSLIPPTIRRLELRFANAFDSFVSVGKSRKSPPETCFSPQIKRFGRLETWIATKATEWDYKNLGGIEFLPRTLQTLYLDTCFRLSAKQVSYLPPSLTELQASLCEGVLEPVAFPLSLLSYVDRVAIDYRLIVESVPSTLTNLEIPSASVPLKWASTCFVPPHLKSLKLSSLPNMKFLSLLPASLTSLQASSPFHQRVEVAMLPRSLKFLSHLSLSGRLCDAPRHLKYLDFSHGSSLEMPPPGVLQSLETYIVQSVVAPISEFDFLPPCLTHLSAFGIQMSEKVIASISNLPNLEYLSLTSHGACTSLESLCLPRLTTLRLQTSHNFEDLDMAPGNQWANRLKTLHLDLRKHPTDPRPITSLNALNSWFSNLPHTLTCLRLLARPSTLPPTLLQHLPPALTSIALNELSSFEASHFQMPITWPPQLTALQLQGRPWSPSISEETILAFLPSTLHCLQIPSTPNFDVGSNDRSVQSPKILAALPLLRRFSTG